MLVIGHCKHRKGPPAVIGAAAIAVGFQIPTKLRPFFNYVTKPVGPFEALFQER
jgi:hypothetical protein